jgi:hypothetical protein
MAAIWSIAAHTVMDGRSKNFILITLSSSNACTEITVRSHIVRTFTVSWTASILYQAGSKCFQRPGLYLFQLISMSLSWATSALSTNRLHSQK